MKRLIYITLIILLSITSVYSCYQIYLILEENYQEQKQNQALSEIAKVDKEEINDKEEVQINFDALTKVNSEIIGWIQIPDTTIDYAMVQGIDNDYYLHYNAMKEKNYAGAVFMDYRNDSYFKDEHTIIYAHNVKHGTMFAPLESYSDESFFNQHPIFYIYTPKQNYEIHIFAFYTTNDTSDAYELYLTPQNKMDYIQQWRNQSLYQNDLQIKESDHIVTLSTCSYERNNQPSELRLVLKGVLKKAS